MCSATTPPCVSRPCSLLHLRVQVGITANPNLVTKDLQMTVRKLDGLVAANEQRAQRALAALLKEAQVPCACSASASVSVPYSPSAEPRSPEPHGTGLSSSRRAKGLLPEDDDAAVGRRRAAKGYRSRRASGAASGERQSKSLPGKLLKGAALSVMAANAVVRAGGDDCTVLHMHTPAHYTNADMAHAAHSMPSA